MKGLTWNCRGIKKKGVSTFLKNLILENNFHFVGLQETMQPDISDHFLRKIDIKQSYLWKWLPSNGRSGGILVGINIEFLEVGSFIEGEHILQMNLWDKKLNFKWNLKTIYGAAHDEGRDGFLAEIALFCGKSKEPFLVGGDFNIIRFASEKNKTGGCK
jgi:exonuclease III